MLVSELYDLYLPLLFNGSLELHQINGVGFCDPLLAIVGDFSLVECSQNVETTFRDLRASLVCLLFSTTSINRS